MKTLYLVRHSKSSWEDQEFDDFDRPLKSSGVKDAYLMGSYLRNKGIMPGLILSSPAARALNTAVVFSGQMGFPYSGILLSIKLYESSAGDILDVISGLNTSEDSIMVFGHDPSLSNLFMKLTGISIEKIPTSAVAAIALNINDWEDIKASKGELVFMEKPKEVKANVK
ncbi:MAG: histidine phosphatase family protein [Bacteroidetes bacterium]|nr:histidine phosphatase family protein [Bacteroidota bacterium]